MAPLLPHPPDRPDNRSERANGPVHADQPQRLKRRADFLAAATGIKVPAKGLVLQVRRRQDNDATRLGFTVSKRVGNAVERNRVRRRLREVIRLNGTGCLMPGHDYVLIGRRAALEVPFARLVEDFRSVLSRIADGRAADASLSGTRPKRRNKSGGKSGSMAPTR